MRSSRILSGLFTAILIVASSLPAWSQEPEPGKDRPDRGERGRRDRNPEERMIESMKSELGLDEEQVAKLKDLIKESQDAAKKASEARDAKIRELLSEEQAGKYDEMKKRQQERQAGRGSAGEGRSPFGRTGRFGRQREGENAETGIPDVLKNVLRNLELTEEQKAKVKEMAPELQEKLSEAMRGLREGNFDPRAAMEKLTSVRDELLEKIKPLLNEEQLNKLEDAAGKGGRKLAEMLQGGRRPGQGGAPNPEQAMKARLDAIRRDIDTIPEVWAILSEKIESILKLEIEYRKQMREMGEQTRETLKDATDDQVKEKMEAFRALRKKMEEELKAKREDLRELLDLKEEAKLIIHGVLD